MKSTIQRSLVLDNVLNRTNHPTADEIFQEIRTDYKNISKATVYRILNCLVMDGLIKRIEIAHHADHFDFELHQHTHFFCLLCQKVYDYPLHFPLDARGLSTAEFEVKSAEIGLVGYCKSCSKT